MNRPVLSLAAAALFLAAMPVSASDTSPSALSADELAEVERLAPEDIAKRLTLHDEPRPFRDAEFLDVRGKDMDLSAFEGEVVVLNFWATWCPPCRKELPYFDALHEDMDEQGLEVVTISLDKQGISKAGRYLENHDLDNLRPFTDPKANLSKQMGVLGLPVTAILGPDGREIGRVLGEAKWDSDEAKAMLRYIIEVTQNEDAET